MSNPSSNNASTTEVPSSIYPLPINKSLTKVAGKPSTFSWLGIDIGGSLAKLVYFEATYGTSDKEKLENDSLKTILFEGLTSENPVGPIGFEDSHLELKNVKIDNYIGNMHFFQFSLERMEMLANELGKTEMLKSINATGGGGFKFKQIFSETSIELNNLDEMQCLLQGLQFLNNNESICHSEAFSIQNLRVDAPIVKEPFEFRNPYPYIVVNMGSGVTVSLLKSPDQQSLISGTCVGGGTFLGICCLLVGCETFEEAMELASRGESTKIDKLISDIYGVAGYSQLGIPGWVVASSFGKMISKKSREQATKEDLAKALLVTITNITGDMVRDCVLRERVRTVVFVGNFLRGNPISMRLLACKMDKYGSKAVFMEHQGYFGALGALVDSV